ncbi:MAG: dihydrodipicolinate synthase family protein [Clostridia bacterium]|nr:dihydrodipicolinate synthase family protein [Clostridia bacterium]
MKNNILFKGIMPALVTPVDENGKIKKDVLKKLVDWQLSFGVSGFYICGSTGEGLLLHTEQRKEMLEATLDAVGGRAPVIDHIGAVNLEDTVELARHAEKAGAAAISSIPPIYFAYSDDDVYNYYKAITDAVKLPMAMYCYPGARPMPVSLIERLMKIDNVIGLKWTNPDYYSLERVKQINGGNINVINGPDEMLICGLGIGADAGIGTTYNIMPGLFVKLFDSFRAGDVLTARKTQDGINNVIAELLKTNAIVATKVVLEGIGFDVGECVRPLRRFSPEEKKALVARVKSFVDFEKQEIIG